MGANFPYTKMRARPTTTGETAIGRSISTLSNRLPGKRWRTNKIAIPTPKIVFRITAQNATMAVTRKACSTLGSVSESMTGLTPCSNVRQKISPTGTPTRTAT